MAEKAFDEVHLFMIKTFKLDRGGDCINISMAICGESAVNIILSGERAKAFLKSEEKDIPASVTSIQHSAGSPSQSS